MEHMDKLDASRFTFERNIGAQTGRSFRDWVALVAGQGFAKHGQMTDWLKNEHGLSHAHANHIAKRVMAEAAPRSLDDPVAHLFTGGKEGLRPLYDGVVAAALDFGPDVEIAPKKLNVSIRRRKQFALLQPTTRTRVDVGLILKGRAPVGRLEASGSFNAMFTHRIKIASSADIDAEVLAWLREAYDDAV